MLHVIKEVRNGLLFFQIQEHTVSYISHSSGDAAHLIESTQKSPYRFYGRETQHQLSRYIPRFRYPAKVTHSRYGTNSHAAVFDIPLNARMVIRISSHRANSHTNANRYFSRLKNMIDQKKLKKS